MSDDHAEFGAETLVSAVEIASLAGVTRAAVSNWRKRYPDFPQRAGGSTRNALFRLTEVQAWLDGQRKGTEMSGEALLWQALRAAYGDDLLPGLADLGELFTAGAAESLDARVRTLAAEQAGQGAPAELLEDLIERFVATTGRAGSEHLSTRRMARAIRYFAGAVTGTVFDPACGTGSLLLGFAGDPGVALTGQEADGVAARLAGFRAGLAGQPKIEIRVGDSLHDDRWPELRAELIICAPPAHATDWGRAALLLDPRWEAGLPPRAEVELAWLQHCYAHAAPGGRVIFVMPPSVAYRKAGRRIRAELLRRGLLTHVIALPAGMAASHAQSVHLWSLRRPLTPDDAGSSVQMIDLSDHDPDGPFEPASGHIVDVPLIDMLDDVVDLTPGRYITASRTDAHIEYASLRASIGSRLDELREMLPPLGQGAGRSDGPTVSVADLARAGLVEIVEGDVLSTGDQLDTAYLRGFVRDAANRRRSTSGSGTIRLDIRGSRVPQMGIDEQRRYGAVFGAIEEFERHFEELAKLGERVAALAREGLTTGALRPAPDGEGAA